MIEGGIEISTSTADIPRGSDEHIERRKSGPEDGGITVEMNPAETAEANPSAFPTGSFDDQREKKN